MLNRSRLVMLLIFALAVVARLGLVAYQYTDDLRNFETGDYTLYRIGGEHIRDNGDLSNSLFLLRPPLFPLLIYLLRVNNFAVLIANVLIGALLAPLAVVLARQLKLREPAAQAAGVIVALDPASIAYSAWLGADPLANLMLMIMIVALLHGVITARGVRSLAWGAVAGGALVLSVLARPAAYLIWIVIGTWLLVAYRRKWAVLAVYVLVGLAGIGGWVLHNGIVFDNYTVSTVGAYSLLYYRAASVEHWATGHDIETVYIDLSRRVEERLGHDTSHVDQVTRHTHYAGTDELTSAMTATALETFAAHPLVYVATIPIGLGRLVLYSSVLPSRLWVLEIPWNLFFVLGTGAGLGLAYRRQQRLLFWCVLLVGSYYTAGTLLAQTSGMDTRMRTMLAPFMAAALAYALDAWAARYAVRPPLSDSAPTRGIE